MLPYCNDGGKGCPVLLTYLRNSFNNKLPDLGKARALTGNRRYMAPGVGFEPTRSGGAPGRSSKPS